MKGLSMKFIKPSYIFLGLGVIFSNAVFAQNQATYDKLVSVASKTIKTSSLKESYIAHPKERILSSSGDKAVIQLGNVRMNGMPTTFPITIIKTLKNGYVVSKNKTDMSVTQNGKTSEKLVQYFYHGTSNPNTVMAYNGKDSLLASYTKDSTKPPLITEESDKLIRIESFSMIDYVSKYNTWTSMILEKDEDIEKIKPGVYFSKETSTTVTFSEDGNQLLKIEEIYPGESEDVTIFSDFVMFDGVSLPTKYTRKHVDEFETPKDHFEISDIKYSLADESVLRNKYEELSELNKKGGRKSKYLNAVGKMSSK